MVQHIPSSEELDELKDRIIELLQEYDLFYETCIYVNGNRYRADSSAEEGYVIDYDLDPHDYFEYAPADPEDQYLSMSFEGPLNHVLNYYVGGYDDFIEKFEKLFAEYGLFFEYGHAWDLSCYLEP